MNNCNGFLRRILKIDFDRNIKFSPALFGDFPRRTIDFSNRIGETLVQRENNFSNVAQVIVEQHFVIFVNSTIIVVVVVVFVLLLIDIFIMLLLILLWLKISPTTNTTQVTGPFVRFGNVGLFAEMEGNVAVDDWFDNDGVSGAWFQFGRCR